MENYGKVVYENDTDILINLGGAGGGIAEMFNTNYNKSNYYHSSEFSILMQTFELS